MPPKKKKTVKTPQKTKPSTLSSTAATMDPTPTPPEPSFAIDTAASTASNDPYVENDRKPEPEAEIETKLEAKPSLEPETTTGAQEALKPASEEAPEAPKASEVHEVKTSAESVEKPSTKTVLRVRKVVKKKIVKKLVPKGSVAAIKLDAVPPQQDGAVSLLESSEKDLSPSAVLDSGTQQIATEKASNPNTLQQPEPVKTVPEVENIAGIKEESRQVDAKDDIAKVKKVRKKIVKKLVPRGSLTAKKVDAAPLQDGIVTLEKNTEKNLNLSSSLDSSFQPEIMVEEDKKLESGKFEAVVKIKEECGLTEEKDDNLESGKDGDRLEASEVKDQAMMGLSERMKKRKSEIFIGGLDRDAKEEDIRSVFGKVGEILELRMMMDGQTGKNKGYAFLRYVEPSQAKRAVAEFSKVEIRGKVCGAAAVQGNDTIFLGNIDKNWKKEDVLKLLKENEIENIDTLTVVTDPNNTNLNRGFAFLELETNRDAQRAYKKLQRNDVFGKGRNIKIAWADSFNIPDEEDMLKVKSVYAEGVPDSWNEDRLKETFKMYGEIERIVLGRNIKSAKRRDIAFINYKTREAAISCIESFSSDDLTVNGSKVNLKVALAKRVQKATQNKGQKPTINNSLKETHKPVQALPLQNYSSTVLGTKRNFSTLGDGMYSDLRGYPRSRLDSGLGIAGSSYAMMPPGGVGSSLHYQHQSAPAGYSTGSFYQSGSNTDAYQTRQGLPPYSSNLYHRYQM